jgi:hypothetical protein
MEYVLRVFNIIYSYFFGVPLWSLLKLEKSKEHKVSLPSSFSNHELIKKYWR